jgi:hypothetical protein
MQDAGVREVRLASLATASLGNLQFSSAICNLPLRMPDEQVLCYIDRLISSGPGPQHPAS